MDLLWDFLAAKLSCLKSNWLFQQNIHLEWLPALRRPDKNRLVVHCEAEMNCVGQHLLRS